jgi:hypothetical protein
LPPTSWVAGAIALLCEPTIAVVNGTLVEAGGGIL